MNPYTLEKFHRRPPIYRPCALDGLTSGIAFAGSATRRLFTKYTGPLIQVALTGGTTLDVGTVGRGAGMLDIETIRVFGAGAEVRIKKIYNQDPNGGGGADLVQNTFSQQASIWDGSAIRHVNGVPTPLFVRSRNTIYSAVPGLTPGTSPALTLATALKRVASTQIEVPFEIGHTSGAASGVGYTPIIFSTNATTMNASYEGVPFSGFTTASQTANMLALVSSKALNADAALLTAREGFADLTRTGSSTQSLALASDIWYVGANHNSAGTVVQAIDANMGCFLLIKADLPVAAGNELLIVERALAQHMSV